MSCVALLELFRRLALSGLMPSTTTLRAASSLLTSRRPQAWVVQPGSSPWDRKDQHLLAAQVGEANLITVLIGEGEIRGLGCQLQWLSMGSPRINAVRRVWD